MNIKWFNLGDSKIEISENTQLATLFIGKTEDFVKSSIRFVHKNPNVNSNILIKAILFDKSKIDIIGNLVIEKGAKNVDTYLKIDILLMSDRCEARAIPSLEITENNVKGGHGASVGPVDPEQMFYLQSKGLNKNEAETILAEGFIHDLLKIFENNDPYPIELQRELDKL